MNSVVLIGRLVRDAEVKVMEGEKNIIKFTLAVDRSYLSANNEREADFIPVSYWTKYAESMQKYLNKGRLIGVKGCIRVKSFDNQEGVRKHHTEIVAEEIKYLERSNKEQAI